MPAGKFSKGNPMGDMIPVEGAFVSAFLPDMPPLYVKLYVYLIYLCLHPEKKTDTLALLAGQTGCSVQEAEEGLLYLSERHLIVFTPRPFTFEVLSATEAQQAEAFPASPALSAYADYFAGIRALFPGRSLSNSDYDKARDWLEIYGFSVEAALMLVAHCIASKDTAISFSYMDKVALSWANEGIVTSEAAEGYLLTYQAKNHEVGKLLQHLNIKRLPTVDEMRLYQTWVEDMGFDLRAVKAACSEMTKIASPNLAYLNKILEKLHGAGVHSEKAVKAFLTEDDAERSLIAAILAELGERARSITPTHTEHLRAFKQAGFRDGILLLIARLVCEKGFHTFHKYTEYMEQLTASMATEEEAVRRFFESLPASAQKKPGDFSGRSEGYGSSVYADPAHLEV